jgi:hypothetical protein
MPIRNFSDADKINLANWRLMVENKLGLDLQFVDDPPCIMFLPAKLQGMAQVAAFRKMARGILAKADELEAEVRADQGGAVAAAEPTASFGPR